MKNEIISFIAFIILIVGIAGLMIITGAMAEKSINPYQFFGWLIFISATLYIDARWIDKHFDGREWI